MSQTKAQLIDTLVASLLPASDSSVDIGSNAVRFANIYGDTLYGNGANLTGINTDLVSDTSPQLGGNLDVNTKNILFGDSASASDDRLIFGAGSDLSIYHDGSHSRIVDNGTGVLALQGSDVNIHNHDASENMILAAANGAVKLYYDHSKKLETLSDGVRITSADDSSGGVRGDFLFQQTDGTTVATFDASASTLLFEDNRKAVFGTGSDLEIYHSGSHSFIKDTGTGQLVLNTNAFRVNNAADSENMITADENGAVSLFHNDSKKFETSSSGATVSGELTVTSNLLMGDGDKLRLGDSNDLELHHSGGENYIQGHLNQLYIRSAQGIYIQPNTNENGVVALANQGTKLYYDNSEKIETRPTGLRMQNSSTLEVNGGLIKFGHCSSAGTDDTLMFGSNGDDLKIFHGGNSQFDNNTGHLEIRNIGDFSSTREIRIRARVDENYLNLYSDGAVKLYYDSSLKLETTANGIKVLDRIEIRNGAIFDNTANGNNMGITFNGDGLRPCNGAGTEVNNTYDLGNSSFRWRNVYTNDLCLSNEGGANDVDGTWGSYTIQEGEESLFLINKRNGKKYKFNLTEVS